jgi:hypothetical protein
MTAVLTDPQLDAFVRDGYVRLDGAFPAAIAAEARAMLWRDLGLEPDDPATWTRPVVRLGMYTQPPFAAAANTAALHGAFDQLVGPGRWLPCRAMGTFPVRFPSPEDPGDTGWHVDGGFPGEDPNDYLRWRVNLRSRGRALLMLFLFSDVGEADAPTRLRVGSHLDVARLLAPAGEAGLDLMALSARLPDLPAHPEVSAVGPAGTVYLCHPFLLHAAQPHRGTAPRFMAQPPLFIRDPEVPAPPGSLDALLANALRIEDAAAYAPVEAAIRRALAAGDAPAN